MVEQLTAYCVKCRQKKEFTNPQEVSMKRKGGKVGRAMTGLCPTCGTKMFRILPMKKQTEEKPEIEKETDSFDETI